MPELTVGKRRVDIFPLVVTDIEHRAQVGEKKYGERLKTFNGRSALQDAYEEALDLAIYLRQQIEEDKETGELAALRSEVERLSVFETWHTNTVESEKSLKHSCVDKCEHEAKYICYFPEDSQYHCLHCECDRMWPIEENTASLRSENERLRELLREAEPYVKAHEVQGMNGWNIDAHNLLSRIAAALEENKRAKEEQK
jgi:hypothetical protein